MPICNLLESWIIGEKIWSQRATLQKRITASPTQHITTNTLQNQKSLYTCNHLKRSLNQSAFPKRLHRMTTFSGCPEVTSILIQEKVGNILKSQARSLGALSQTILSLGRMLCPSTRAAASLPSTASFRTWQLLTHPEITHHHSTDSCHFASLTHFRVFAFMMQR